MFYRRFVRGGFVAGVVVCSVLSSGVAVASEFESLGTDSMQTVAPAQREDFRPDHFTDDEDFAAVAPADGQWRTRSADGGRSALDGAEENSGDVEESPRFVPTRLGGGPGDCFYLRDGVDSADDGGCLRFGGAERSCGVGQDVV